MWLALSRTFLTFSQIFFHPQLVESLDAEPYKDPKAVIVHYHFIDKTKTKPLEGWTNEMAR